MKITIAQNALDRVPLVLFIDDSAALVNLNYFWLRDRNAHTGENQRWQDIPVVIPEAFTREWGEWCAENGVRGKFSVVPCPAGLGRIDRGLPLFGQAQLDSWLDMCRSVIQPNFDINPEMLSHTFVLDLDTMRPVAERIWEQYEWSLLPEDREAHLVAYIQRGCEILCNVGLVPEGVTSPGGFGHKNLEFYAKVAKQAVINATGNPTPYFLQQVWDEPIIGVPVRQPDRAAKNGIAEIIGGTGDWTGNWTGYGQVNPDRYITSDLQGGRLPQLINAGSVCILISHWQGFYGLHNDDRRGFGTLKTVVRRLRERDPHGEQTRWRKPSELARYACARELATLSVAVDQEGGAGASRRADGAASTGATGLAGEHGVVAQLDLPIGTPELTLRAEARLASVQVDAEPLREVQRRQDFAAGTWLREGDHTWLAFDAAAGHHEIRALKME